jgi:catechol 2,3-dioxygenase-like lactoylglutathione lyase family enzyme
MIAIKIADIVNFETNFAMMKRKLGAPRKQAVRYPRLYSITVFTNKWREVRDFYTRLLGGGIISERKHRYFDLLIGGMPISFRACEDGEVESHFHLYLALRDREALLEKLREAGVIVRLDGPYASFLDPDGRTIKLSEEIAVLV